jgi:CBS-domain-containing membrane protein
MLTWSLPHALHNHSIAKVMSRPVVCVKMQEEFKYLLEILKNHPFNGFPVVDEVDGVSLE